MRGRVRYLWFEADTEGVEVLSACLSATFALLLARNGSGGTAIQHANAFAALCLAAAGLKLAGVVSEYTIPRVLGLLLGTIFWTMLAGVTLATVHQSVSWLCFAVLAGAQVWAGWRLIAGRWR